MATSYFKTFEVGWAHVDPNFHMRGSVYFDFCDEVRLGFFHSQGMPVTAWRKYNAGPVILEQHIQYFRELHMQDTVRVFMKARSLSEDKRFSKVVHEFFRGEDECVAKVEVTVAFLDLTERKLKPAPDAIVKVWEQLETIE